MGAVSKTEDLVCIDFPTDVYVLDDMQSTSTQLTNNSIQTRPLQKLPSLEKSIQDGWEPNDGYLRLFDNRIVKMCVSNYEVTTPCIYSSNTTSHPAHTSQNLYTPMPTSVSSSLCLTARSRLSLSSSTRPTPPARSLPGSRSAPSRRRTKTSRQDFDGEVLDEREGVDVGPLSLWFVKCSACGREVRVAYSDNQGGGTRLQESYWFGHKLLCGEMQ